MHLKLACASPLDQRTVARSQFLLPKHRPAAFQSAGYDPRRDTATGRQLENFSRVHRECSLRFCARRNGQRGAPLTLPFAGSGHNRQTRICYSNPLRARCLRAPPASSCNSSEVTVLRTGVTVFTVAAVVARVTVTTATMITRTTTTTETTEITTTINIKRDNT